MQADLKLEIYIDSDCWNCKLSLDLADGVRKRFPGLSVRVIDLKNTCEEIPEPIFAVPTFLLGGETISLGNPEMHALHRQIEQRLGTRDRDRMQP